MMHRIQSICTLSTRRLALSLLLAVGLLFAACQPDGADIGDLYGRWQFRGATCGQGTFASGDTIFLAFQGSAYEYQPAWGVKEWGPFEHEGDELRLYPLVFTMRLDALGLPEAFGTGDSIPECFTIDRLTVDDLVLSRHDSVWRFEKYLK